MSDRDHAEIADLKTIMASLTEEDVLTRPGIQARIEQLQQELAKTCQTSLVFPFPKKPA